MFSWRAAGGLPDLVKRSASGITRGISEILDQTVEEKRRGAAVIEGMRIEITGLGERAAAIGGELAELRTQEWSVGVEPVADAPASGAP